METRKGPAPSADIGDQDALAAIIDSASWARHMASLRVSPRERQILESLLGGSDGEGVIAKRLGISARTVHTHLERLYRKLGVTSRSQLLAFLFISYATHVNARGDGQAVTVRTAG